MYLQKNTGAIYLLLSPKNTTKKTTDIQHIIPFPITIKEVNAKVAHKQSTGFPQVFHKKHFTIHSLLIYIPFSLL
ncbi:hypothetical protein DRF57_19300 [Chryseobacterium rhizosphaerae]|uniref:Uncharacterized protein n=1 Tax=Chryseobacterium rhizosphaerae TaxID=395937 RepID=A0ABX9IGL6_9FLAO|nr:hypothetical protein DRF57_19300 [Chryseobacterium rhizosphaerae]